MLSKTINTADEVHDIVLSNFRDMTYYLISQGDEHKDITKVVIKAWRDVANLPDLSRQDKVG